MTEYLNDSPISEPLIFDSHSHYDDSKFDGIRDELLSSLPCHGVGRIITCGCDLKSSKAAIGLAEKYDYIYCAVGIHPENLDSKTTVDEIERLASHKKVVAIGEIGLDYYYCRENRNEQLYYFEQQIILAKKLELPVIVHDREAHFDTLEILKKHKPRGVVHCFSGSTQMAAEILKIGMYIGVGGVITFKNSKKLPEVVKMLPPDRMLIETDCPYLAPEPYRGKLCHSGMIALTAEKIAETLGCTAEEVLRQTYINAQKLFCL